jgi:general secretion pathway protein I
MTITSTRKANGFALLEIIVALAIVGGAVVALLGRMQSIANTAQFIERKTVAHWIAENKLQEIKTEQRIRQNTNSPVRKDSGELEFESAQWYWRYEIIEVPLDPALAPAKMFRVNVDIGLEPEKSLANLQGFIRG